MKTFSRNVAILLTAFMAATGLGQIITPPPVLPTDPTDGAGSALVGADWQALPRDSGSTEWQKLQLGTNLASGKLEIQTNRYIEIGNNLNFLSDTGALERSVDAIDIMTNSGGGAA